MALRKLLWLALSLAFAVAAPSIAYAQDASSDQAKTLLEKGVAEFKNLAFPEAKATLLGVDRKFLSPQEQNTLDEYLVRADDAIRKQSQALDAYRTAEEALKAGDLEKAKSGFTAAAASEYLPGSKRQQATEQLTLVQRRIEAVIAAAQDVPAVQPAAKSGEATVQKSLTDARRRRELARELLAKGKKAMAEGQYEEAVRFFERALILQPDLEEAKRQLENARQYTATAGQPRVLSDFLKKRRIQKQRIDMEFDKIMSRASERLARADSKQEFEAAGNDVELAREMVQANKTLYSAEEYQQKLLGIDALSGRIQARRDTWERAQADKRRIEMMAADEKRRREEEAQRRERVRTLTSQARTLMGEQNYGQAQEMVLEILKIEPKNGFAQDNKGLLEQLVLLRNEAKAVRTGNLEEQRSLVEVRISEIPWYKLIMYPEDWREITARREPFSVAAAESEQDRQLRAKLRRVIPEVRFNKVDFRRAVDWLQEVGGINIFVKWSALELANVGAAQVDLRLSNVAIETVLEFVLEQVGGDVPLGYMVSRGVLTVSTKDDLKQKTYNDVYDIRDLIYRVPNIRQPQGLGLGGRRSLADRDEEGDGGGGGLFEEAGPETGRPGQELGMTRQQLVDAIITTIKTSIDPNSWPPLGQIGSIQELNGQLIVTQTAENHQGLLDLINKLREARAIQIAIEARFISVTSGFLERIGVDLDFFFNIGSRLDERSSLVGIPGTSHYVAQRSGSPWDTAYGRPGGAGNDRFTYIPIIQDSYSFATSGLDLPLFGETSIGKTATNSALTLFGTFLDDIQVDFLIQATQAHDGSRTLAAPRITLFNGQASEVVVETQQSYISDIEPEISENVVAYDIEIDEVATGTRLWVEATVSADRRYVTITVVPQLTRLKALRWWPYDPSIYIAQGFLPPAGQAFVQLPELDVQTLQTTVSVPDGGTLLLGGRKMSGQREREMGAPVLSKIPILNRAFSNRGFARDEDSLLILIKPTIIIQREEEEKAFP